MKAPAPVIDRSDERWHVDKKVPVSLIVTLVVVFGGQTATALIWASKADARIERLEDTAKLAVPQVSAQNERLTRVEVKLESALDSLSEIKTLLRAKR